MHFASTWVVAVALASPSSDPTPDRSVQGPDSVAWPSGHDDEVVEPQVPAASDELDEDKEPTPPSPRAARVGAQKSVRVALGLDPSAPGTKAERALVGQLADSVPHASNPSAESRRLRAGSPTAREVCREGRDDLVIMVGYVGDRPEPVLLPYDCSLDVALAVRNSAAATQSALVPSLWQEHEALVRDGVKARRRLGRLGPKARAGIVAGVVVVVVGVAVGLLVANALRDEVVVLKVSP